MEKVLRNSAWLISAQIFTKAIAFFYTLFLARSLGVSDFGLYVVALSYFALISSIADLGITRYLTREIALSGQKIGSILSTSMLFRLIILAITFLGFALANFLFDSDKLRGYLSVLAVLAILPQGISLTLDAVFIALHRNKFSAIGAVFLSIATSTTGFLLVQSSLGVFGAVMAVTFGQIIYALALALLSGWQKVDFWDKPDFAQISKILKGSAPYGFLGAIGLLYFRVDTLILSYIKGSYDTGIYGAAYKFLEALVFIPGSLALTLFPVMAKLHEIDNAQIKSLYLKIMGLMSVLGLLVAIVFILILPIVIRIFLPAYLSSIQVIQVLAISIPFMFVHVPASQVLLSSNKYLKPIILISVANLAFNVILNLIYIPMFGYMAAAWITVASDVLSLLLLSLVIQRYFFRNA
ncbi:flippase [Candidatus Daviesbacteria bacterium]|nr:flippase [Candidatus Daviesbacteria bacterium]